MKGVIIAAGYGTRFLPASKTVPKEMFPLIDKPAIAFIVEEFLAAGISEILIVSSRRKKALEDYFDREVELEGALAKAGKDKQLEAIRPPRANIFFVRQQKMLGTGDALLLTEEFAAGEQICVAYPDDLVFGERPLARELIEATSAPNQTVLAALPVPPEETHRYGIIENSSGNQVSRIVEKPSPGTAPSNLAVIGRFILSPDIFPLLREERRQHQEGEFFHINAVNSLARDGKVFSKKFSGERLDIGTPAGYVKATLSYALSNSQYREELLPFLKQLLRETDQE